MVHTELNCLTQLMHESFEKDWDELSWATFFPWDCKFALFAWWPSASTNTLLWFWLHFLPRVTWPWWLEVCLAVSVTSVRFATMNHQKKKAAVDHFILDGDCRSTSTDAHSKHNGGAISVSHLQSPGSRLLTCAASWHRWSNGHPWRCDQSSEVYIEPESVANILHYTCPMSSHVCIRALVKTHTDSTASDLNLALSARVDPLPFFTWRKLSRRLLSADSK